MKLISEQDFTRNESSNSDGVRFVVGPKLGKTNSVFAANVAAYYMIKGVLVLFVILMPMQAWADACAGIRSLGLSCQEHEVALYKKPDGAVFNIRSTSVVLLPNHFAIGCCTQSEPAADFWLVTTLSAGTELDGSDDYCRIPILGPLQALNALVRKGYEQTEFEAIENSVNGVSDVILELRARSGGAIEAAELCGIQVDKQIWNIPSPSSVNGTNVGFEDWIPAGQGIILQIENWDEEA